MKGTSKRVSLKEEEVIQSHIFPNEEGAWHSSCKKRLHLGHTGFAVACPWNTTEPKKFWGWTAVSGFSAHGDQGRMRVESTMKYKSRDSGTWRGHKGQLSMTLLWAVWIHSCRGEVWEVGKGRKEDGTCAHLLLWEIWRITHKGPGPRGQCLKDCQQQ